MGDRQGFKSAEPSALTLTWRRMARKLPSKPIASDEFADAAGNGVGSPDPSTDVPSLSALPSGGPGHWGGNPPALRTWACGGSAQPPTAGEGGSQWQPAWEGSGNRFLYPC